MSAVSRSASPSALLISAFIALACNACAPEIGDECETDLDCSAQGSRPCDRTQTGGYCTIAGCEQGTCPEEAVCVKFRPTVERQASTFCMLRCGSDGDCRSSEGYRCFAAEDFGSQCAMDEVEATVLDGDSKKFCALEITSVPDAGAPLMCGEPETQ